MGTTSSSEKTIAFKDPRLSPKARTMDALAALLPNQPTLLPSPAQLDAIWRIAEWFAAAVQRGMDRPHGAHCVEIFALKILMGQELGVPPAAAVYGIDLSRGNVGVSAKIKVALVRKRHIAELDLVEATPERAVCRIHRTDWPADRYVDVVWTAEDTKRAGLAGKDNHKHYPTAMNAHRAQTQAVDLYCQDAAMGLGYTYDELGMETDEQGERLESPIARSADSPISVDSEGVPPNGESSTPAPESLPGVASQTEDQPAAQPPSSNTPAPAPEQLFPEAAAHAEIRALLESLPFATPHAWRRYCEKYAGGKRIPAFNAAESAAALAHLKVLSRIDRVRRVAGLQDETWQQITLAKRGVNNELDLTPEAARELDDKIWSKLTPFDRQGIEPPPTAHAEGGEAATSQQSPAVEPSPGN